MEWREIDRIRDKASRGKNLLPREQRLIRIYTQAERLHDAQKEKEKQNALR